MLITDWLGGNGIRPRSVKCCSAINYICSDIAPPTPPSFQQYQYAGDFISKDRQLKPNRGHWNTKQRESQ